MLGKIYNHFVAPKLQEAAAAAAARKQGMPIFRVLGANMEPSLRKHDVAWYLPIEAGDLKRGQVVAVKSQEFESAIVPYRVLGLPGETVEIREGDLYVDGSRVPEPYVQAGRADEQHSRTSPSLTVPSRYVWLLGDFRDISKDSRSVGPIAISDIVGRVDYVHGLGGHQRPRAVR